VQGAAQASLTEAAPRAQVGGHRHHAVRLSATRPGAAPAWRHRGRLLLWALGARHVHAPLIEVPVKLSLGFDHA
jgi:hypothetical protein